MLLKTVATIWTAVTSMFTAQSHTRIANLWVYLANTKKEGKTMHQYFTAVKQITNELASAGRPMEEDEIVEHLVAGFDDPYNPIFTAIGANPTIKLTISKLFAQVSAYDNCMAMLSIKLNSGSGNSSVYSPAR
jgi:hypothetical protein